MDGLPKNQGHDRFLGITRLRFCLDEPGCALQFWADPIERIIRVASKLYGPQWVEETLARIAGEIANNRAPGAVKSLVGLRTRGAIMADRIRELLRSRHGLTVDIGYLDATLYRDDLHRGAGLKAIKPTEIDFDINDRSLILVDDVLSTGRTIRAAMGALFDYGRPASVRLCVMLDRGGRELPIQADFCGARVEVPRDGLVRLKFSEVDPQGDAVYVIGPGEPEA